MNGSTDAVIASVVCRSAGKSTAYDLAEITIIDVKYIFERHVKVTAVDQ